MAIIWPFFLFGYFSRFAIERAPYEIEGEIESTKLSEQGGDEVHYELEAFIVHSGKTVESGHYYACQRQYLPEQNQYRYIRTMTTQVVLLRGKSPMRLT